MGELCKISAGANRGPTDPSTQLSIKGDWLLVANEVPALLDRLLPLGHEKAPAEAGAEVMQRS